MTALRIEHLRLANFRCFEVLESEREQRATGLLNQAIRPTFVSARVAWLRRQLGEGR